MNYLKLLFRNRYKRDGTPAKKNKVNLEWFNDKVNLGDYLSVVVCNYMLSKKDLSFDISVKHTKHLMAVGSVLGGRGDFDAVVWGSGVMSFSNVRGLVLRSFYQKLDVRAVRGPITRDALIQCKIKCPEVYGDPAVLMPLFYTPNISKTYDTAVIMHFNSPETEKDPSLHYLDIKTRDYQSFIDNLCSAQKVISSTLHGIILAESYGIPAVFLSENREREMMKYYDWYYSTGRSTVSVSKTLDEAMQAEPMPLPDLSAMRKALMDSFPYDLWGK